MESKTELNGQRILDFARWQNTRLRTNVNDFVNLPSASKQHLLKKIINLVRKRHWLPLLCILYSSYPLCQAGQKQKQQKKNKHNEHCRSQGCILYLRPVCARDWPQYIPKTKGNKADESEDTLLDFLPNFPPFTVRLSLH